MAVAGTVRVKVLLEENDAKRFFLGSNYAEVFVDNNTGKIVAVGDQYQLGVTDINTTNNFLKKADGIELLNKYKDQINPKLKQYNTNWEYTDATAVIADDALYTKKTEQISKDLLNTDRGSFNFVNDQNKAFEKLKTLEKPSTKNQVIVFPSDLIARGNGGVSYSQDTIRIKALQYIPPQRDILRGRRNVSIYDRGVLSNNQFLNDLEKDYKYEGEVILPMPLSIRDAVGAEWGVGALNTLALGLFSSVRDTYEPGGLGAAGALLRTGFKGFQAQEAWAALADAFTNAPGEGALKQQILNDLSSEIVGKLGIQVDPLQVLSRATGSVVNNNAELLFRGPKLRSFDFSWKLSPRSAEDSRRIRQMVRFFKIKSLPSVSTTGTIFMQTPNVFIVEYKKSNNERNEALPQPKVCALLDFRVDYTPDGVGWAAYGDDSQPVTSVISAVFHELTPLFANEYANQSADSVGF